MALPFDIRGPAPVVETLLKFQSGFFDRAKVIKSLRPRERAVMSRFGAFVWRRAKTSLRYRKAASAPGSPPSAHRTTTVKKTNRSTGVTKMQSASPLREFLYFAYDDATHSVVIGPAATNQVFFDKARRPVRGTVPGVLERGGQVTILERQRKDGTWTRGDLRLRRFWGHLPTRYRTANYPPRPYMKPAMLAELPKFAPLFEKLGLSSRA
jgi:hypothetical protein